LSESGKNKTPGVLGILQRVREYRTFEFGDIKLEDDKPIAFKYVPFTMADWDAVEMEAYSGLPIFNEAENSEEKEGVDHWTIKEKLLLRDYYRVVCKHGIRQVRDFEDNQTVWRDIKVIPDSEPDSQEADGSVRMSMATLAALGVVIPLGAAILTDANYGGDLSQYVERGFRG